MFGPFCTLSIYIFKPTIAPYYIHAAIIAQGSIALRPYSPMNAFPYYKWHPIRMKILFNFIPNQLGVFRCITYGNDVFDPVTVNINRNQIMGFVDHVFFMQDKFL